MREHDLRLIRIVLAVVWIVTGILSICTSQVGLDLLVRVGLHGAAAQGMLYLAATLDIVLGILTLIRFGKWLWITQAMLIVVYSIIIATRLPEFLLHPFGPVLKNLPILLMLWLLYKNDGSAA